MHVISFVRLRRRIWFFVKVLVALALIGLVLPRLAALVGKAVSPQTGWKTSVLDKVAAGLDRVLAALDRLLKPVVATLQRHYRGN